MCLKFQCQNIHFGIFSTLWMFACAIHFPAVSLLVAKRFWQFFCNSSLRVVSIVTITNRHFLIVTIFPRCCSTAFRRRNWGAFTGSGRTWGRWPLGGFAEYKLLGCPDVWTHVTYANVGKLEHCSPSPLHKKSLRDAGSYREIYGGRPSRAALPGLLICPSIHVVSLGRISS